MNADFVQILNFLHKAEALKRELRHSWLSNGRQESVAEHSWRMSLMGILLIPYIKQKINIAHLLQMIICHDLVEIEVGDLPRPLRPDKVEKLKQERTGMNKLVKQLPNKLGDKINQLWEEFESGASNEAKLAQALDKMEVVIQHNEADISTWSKKNNEYGLNLHGQDKAVSKVIDLVLFNKHVYQECRQKIMDEGLDVKEFEKEWEEFKDKF